MTLARILRLQWSILLTIVIFSLSIPAYAKYSGGTGEPNDPYQIATAADLILLGNSPNDYGKHFVLTADIDLDPRLGGRKVFNKAVIASTWYGVTPFVGVFDGNGHTISNLTIRGAQHLGLFGTLTTEARIGNLGLLDVNITGSDDYVGGLAGANEGGIVTECYSTGTVDGQSAVGGLIGYYGGGSVTNCYSSGSVNGHECVGGLVGINDGELIACYATGSVRGLNEVGGLVGLNNIEGDLSACHADSNVVGSIGDIGGLVGHNDEAKLSECYATGSVGGESFMSGYVGGLVGSNSGGPITNCWASGSVSGSGWSTGGLVGHSTRQNRFGLVGRNGVGKISGCSATGAVTATNRYVAGLVGNNYRCDIISCRATGDVTSSSNSVGGLVGENYGCSIVDCNATGSVIGKWNVGGLVGCNSESTLTCCYAAGDVVGTESTLGTIGGLIGENSAGIIKNCYALGVVDGSGPYVGGFMGSNRGGSLIACEAAGVVSGTKYVGGLLGSNGGIIADCRSTGSVEGTGDYVGGLIGSNSGSVMGCHSTGWVSGGGQDIGGLVGRQNVLATILNCYTTGSVSGKEYVGGLVGHAGGTILNSYSTGMVSGETHFGGLAAGYARDSFIQCFWDTQTSGQTESYGGIGLNTAQMQDIQTYLDAGWDFAGTVDDGTSEIWQMPAEGGYPILAIFNGYTPHQLQGEGTPEEPYLLSDVMQLGAVVHYNPCAHYKLATSIDLSNIRWCSAVIPWFFGTFDGNNLEISHLTIHGYGGGHVGLFGQVALNAEVKNLGLVNVNITDPGSRVGGLAGANEGALTKSYCTGAVSGKNSIGGLVGYNEGNLTQCFSSVVVSGERGIGGLVGDNKEDVTDCYSTGQVNGNLGAGGLLGLNTGDVTQCYSIGAVSGGEDTGGLVGSFWPDDVTASFWDLQTSGQTTSAGGTGKTTAEMQRAITFLEVGWDFVNETDNGTEDIWCIFEGQDYPRLWWEINPDEPLENIGE